MGLSNRKRKRSPLRILLFIIILGLAGLGGTAYILYFEGVKPEIDFSGLPSNLGKNNILTFKVSDIGNGIQSIRVTAKQDEKAKVIYSTSYERTQNRGEIGPLQSEVTVEFNPIKAGFHDGQIDLEVSATDFSLRGMFRGNNTISSQSLPLDTKPPKLRLLHSERYISPGGAGIVIYTVDDSKSMHGVVINGFFNTGHPVGDGRENTYIAFFALPYNATEIAESKVTATDTAGNTTTNIFTTKVKKSPQKFDRINISDGFLNKKIPEFEQYYPDMKGDFLQKYLHTNKIVRQENNKKIALICSNPENERFWKGKFLRMAGSPRAGFAEYRTYYYNNKPIDKQVHLGMDIASTKNAKIKAANSGKVVYADYLGIYGNMIILDHGQGVYSLYSHLNQINVAVDDMVTKGDAIGLSGTTGMAGGDHLHFSILINGIFTNPLEWWDPNWIDVTIDEPLIDTKF